MMNHITKRDALIACFATVLGGWIFSGGEPERRLCFANPSAAQLDALEKQDAKILGLQEEHVQLEEEISSTNRKLAEAGSPRYGEIAELAQAKFNGLSRRNQDIERLLFIAKNTKHDILLESPRTCLED